MLVKCPDCGTDISDQSPACVKCGRPMEKGYRLRKAGLRMMGCGAMLLVVGIGALLLLGVIGAFISHK